jgi:hypothetical protein
MLTLAQQLDSCDALGPRPCTPVRRVTRLLVELTTRHDACELPHDEIITSTRYTHDFGVLPASAASERSAGDRGLVLAAPADAGFEEAVEDCGWVTHLVLGPQILDHLVEVRHGGAHLVAPGAAPAPLSASSSACRETTAARARGRMFELTAAVDPAAEPPYIYWWTDAQAHATAGSSALALGKPSAPIPVPWWKPATRSHAARRTARMTRGLRAYLAAVATFARNSSRYLPIRLSSVRSRNAATRSRR